MSNNLEPPKINVQIEHVYCHSKNPEFHNSLQLGRLQRNSTHTHVLLGGLIQNRRKYVCPCVWVSRRDRKLVCRDLTKVWWFTDRIIQLNDEIHFPLVNDRKIQPDVNDKGNFRVYLCSHCVSTEVRACHTEYPSGGVLGFVSHHDCQGYITWFNHI